MQLYLFPVYTLAHLILLIWALRLVRAQACGALILAITVAGLVYDNLMIALGATIGVGPLLELLSWPRFILHALVTPLTLIALTRIAVAADVQWVRSRSWGYALPVLVVGSIVYGSVTHLIGMEIHPSCADGVLRYSASVYEGQQCYPGQLLASGGGFPWPSILTTVVALAVGVSLWSRHRWPWLLVGALLMFAAGAVPVSVFGLGASNGGEVILLCFYLATCSRFARGYC